MVHPICWASVRLTIRQRIEPLLQSAEVTRLREVEERPPLGAAMNISASGRGLSLLLVAIMLMSTTLVSLEFNPETPVAESQLDSEEVVLNDFQKDTLLRASGRASVTNWVRQAGPDTGTSNGPGNYNSVAFQSMVMAANGNDIIVAGTLRGDVKFDSITPPTQGGFRAFVGSLTKYGAWNWITTTSVSQGSTGGAILGDITVDSSGNIWVVGVFWVNIQWGTQMEMSDGSSIDGFVAKMSSSGSWLWGTRQGGSSNIDTMHGVAVDSNGDGYVVGSFEDHTYFGNTSRNIQKGQDGFIVKIDGTNGSYVWDRIVGGNIADNMTAVEIGPQGGIFVTGYYQGDIVFASTTLLNTGAPSVFVAEIDSSGTWLWANEARTVYGGIIPYDIVVDSESIYLGGDVVGLIELDGVNWYVNGTVQNAFVARMNKTGTWLWGLNSSGHTQHLQDLALNPLGGVAAVGWFDMDHEFIAYGYFGSTNLTEAPYAAFFAGVSPTGQWMWAEAGGGPKFDSGNAAVFTEVGNLVMAGRFCVGHDGAGCSFSVGTANYSSGAYMDGSGFIWSLNTDSDLDNVSDVNDNCPLNFNPTQDDFDGDTLGDACDADMDGDAHPDVSDACIGPAINWDSTDWVLDSDQDGCRDSDEDSDDDADGVDDVDDLCNDATTLRNWTSNDANDYDDDGCHDTIEDDDDDGDGVDDINDDCAFAPSERNWTSSPATDHDGDGCKDGTEEDEDSDNDGILDSADLCATGVIGWQSGVTNDHDGDGCRDSDEDLDDDQDGIVDSEDDCTPMAANWDSSTDQDLDKDGCRDIDEDDDDDGDGMPDDVDQCPRGNVGWTANEINDNDGDGCRDSGEDLDDDGDLILDIDDDCPSGATGWISEPSVDADRDGCRDADEDWDDDGDGLWEFDAQGNVIDQCPGTPLSEIQFVDNYGCSPSQADDDGDGVQNIDDECPDDAAVEGLDRDENGCTDDIDQDGVTDDIDAYPNDPDQSVDSDGDGFGDNANVSGGDPCPNTPSEWVESAKTTMGCAWEEFDDDEDGYLNGLDNCSDTPASEKEEVDANGCSASERDSDGDGVMDSDDQCPETTPGAKMVDSGCSEAQLAYDSSGGSSGIGITTILILLAILLIIAGGAGAFFVMNRDSSAEDYLEDRPSAEMVLNSLAEETSDENAISATETESGDGDGGGINVDDDGTEWWQDEAGAWWYRTVAMDDWAIWED